MPFPQILENAFYGKKISEWRFGKLKQRTDDDLFIDKTNNLQGEF